MRVKVFTGKRLSWLSTFKEVNKNAAEPVPPINLKYKIRSMRCILYIVQCCSGFLIHKL